MHVVAPGRLFDWGQTRRTILELLGIIARDFFKVLERKTLFGGIVRLLAAFEANLDLAGFAQCIVA